MEVFGFTIARTKALPALRRLSGTGGWLRVISEPFTGAWQSNADIQTDSVLPNPTVFACVTLIMSDIGKLGFSLVEKDGFGIWNEVESSAFSPLTREPNRYQDISTFHEQWVASKLTWGNTYVLLVRDNRNVVKEKYILDPSRVTPLVAADGSIYYELRRDDLSGLSKDSVTVPASEIEHDRINAIYHPLVGLSPIYAAGAAALQGLYISSNSSKFFSNGSQPGGILTAPQGITKAQAVALKTDWETEFSGDNAGKVAVLAGDLKYTSMAMSAVDAQLIDQLKWTDEKICSCFHVPPYLVNVGPAPPYANAGPLVIQYFQQCLQANINHIEKCWEKGQGLNQKIDGKQYGVQFDISDLIWMDALTRAEVSSKAIGSGAMAPNESRKLHYGLGPVKGGESPYLQQQNFSLAALAKRDAGDPFAAPTPTAQPDQTPSPERSIAVSLAHRVKKAQEARAAA
jgi:HK97 family phage portal protein